MQVPFAKPVGEWLSLVEHLVRDQGVGGSNPLSPTNLLDFKDLLVLLRPPGFLASNVDRNEAVESSANNSKLGQEEKPTS